MKTYTIRGTFKNLPGKHAIAKGISNKQVAESIALKAISNGWWDLDVEEIDDSPEQSSKSPV